MAPLAVPGTWQIVEQIIVQTKWTLGVVQIGATWIKSAQVQKIL